MIVSLITCIGVRWLLVFDNVEDQAVLSRLLPTGGPGSIVITCRSELTAASSANEIIEVTPFSDSDGGELLLREIGSRAEEGSEQTSTELATLLGGHALTINVMARSIVARKKSVADFLSMYKENPRSLHKRPRRKIHNLYNQYYDKTDDLESLWAIPFSQLEPEESRVFGVMTMCGPSKIPSSIFQTKAFGLTRYQ